MPSLRVICGFVHATERNRCLVSHPLLPVRLFQYYITHTSSAHKFFFIISVIQLMSSPTEITYPFTFSPEVDNFTKSPQHLLARNPDLAGLAVGAFVFNRHGKVLLIKRSKADSYPDLWEVPGKFRFSHETTAKV